MKQKTLIIHGWSDVSASFQNVQQLLQKANIGGEILFVDYESREDNMTFNDISDGLRDRLLEMGLIDQDDQSTDGSEFNVVVHSTGGLVVRHWLSTYYAGKLDRCPVKRIVMMAPANFGSPLTKDGKSFLGALVAGRRDVAEFADFLETGQQILDGLELGSSFQWKLAHKDVLSTKDYYSPASIHTTILVGIEDYKEFLRSFANKPGTDGTVVIAGTQLDTVKFTLNFNNAKYEWSRAQSISSPAFAVLPEVNHSSIVAAAADQRSLTSQLLVKALTPKKPDEFKAFQAELSEITDKTYEKSTRPKYEQFLVHATDECGESLKDFTLEFFVSKKSKVEAPRGGDSFTGWLKNLFSDDNDEFSTRATRALCCEFEKFSKDLSYRRFLVDVQELRRILVDAEEHFKEPSVLCMKIWVPAVDRGIKYAIQDLKALVIYDSETARNEISEYTPGKGNRPALFYPNTTTLIELQVNRFNDYVWVDSKPMNKKQRNPKGPLTHVKAG